MSTVFALVVTAVILASLWGYGAALSRLCNARDMGFGIVTIFGLGFYLALSGPLELFGLASSSVLLGFVLAGLALAALMHRSARPSRPGEPLQHPAMLALLAVLFALFVINLSTWHFVNSDDLQGYLVMPERVLQTGSTGRDPFLFRRYESGLGGSQYLYALFLTGLDFTQLRMADLGMGSVLLAALITRHARQTSSGSAMLPLALALAFVTVIFSPIANMTPDICAIALLYAILLTGLSVVRKPAIALGDHLLLGLLAFTLVCLRSTYIVSTGAVLAALYLTLLLTRATRLVILAGAAASGLVVLLSLPWMVAADQVVGTPLYPFLGFGSLTHDEVRGFASPLAFLRVLIGMAACYALAVWAWAVGYHQRRITAAPDKLFLAAALVLSVAGLAFAELKYTVFGYRYGFVGFVTLPLFLATECLHTAQSWRRRPGLALSGLVLLLLFVLPMARHLPVSVGSGQLYVAIAGRPSSQQLAVAPLDVSDPAQRSTLTAKLHAMQDAVPPGQLLLARVDAPLLLDFRRNPIWVMDHPGQIGPAPGIPQQMTEANWTAYLQQIGVRYVAYSYADEAAESPAMGALFRSTLPGPSYWQDKLEERLAAVQSVLLQMRDHGPLLYDDGERFVAEIASPRLAATRRAPDHPPGT